MATSGRRTGLPTINKLAKDMCKYTTRYDPIIRKLFPESVAVLAALETANAACAVLVQQSELVIDEGE
jgi:hypothetical protein